MISTTRTSSLIPPEGDYFIYGKTHLIITVFFSFPTQFGEFTSLSDGVIHIDRFAEMLVHIHLINRDDELHPEHAGTFLWGQSLMSIKILHTYAIEEKARMIAEVLGQIVLTLRTIFLVNGKLICTGCNLERIVLGAKSHFIAIDLELSIVPECAFTLDLGPMKIDAFHFVSVTVDETNIPRLNSDK